MAVEVLLPKLGLTMEEGTIGEWLFEDGQRVAVGDPILRLETDKITVDVEAEAEGLLHRAVPEGSTLPPGAVVAWLLADGEGPPAAAPPGAEAVVPEPVVATEDGVRAPSGRVAASPLARRRAREHGVDLASVAGTGPGGRVLAADVQDVVAAAGAAGVLASAPPASGEGDVGPLVRRDAVARGVDLAGVRGTGPGGRITRGDVRAASQPSADTSGRAYDVVPLTGLRGTIADRMHASLTEMAQLTLGREVEVEEALVLRDRLKADWAPHGLTVPTVTDLVLKASALALREHPDLNATVSGRQIRRWRDVHVGLAVALDVGLVVPVVRDADGLPLTRLAERTRSLAAAARGGTLTLEDLEGATFTVTSLGTAGIDFFTPVVSPGNVAILGVGRVREGVRWASGVPQRHRTLTLSLTFDHRAVDGAPAAAFLGTIADLLASPTRLLA